MESSGTVDNWLIGSFISDKRKLYILLCSTFAFPGPSIQQKDYIHNMHIEINSVQLNIISKNNIEIKQMKLWNG